MANELEQAVIDATAKAIDADDEWQEMLDAYEIERYSPAARQEPLLAMLYRKKVAADEKMRQATIALRYDSLNHHRYTTH